MERSTKETILDVAIELFADKGYNRVSIREIAQAVGIRGSSIYNHFESKEALLDAVLRLYKEESDRYFGSYYQDLNLDKLIETFSVEELLERSLMMSMGFMGIPKVDRVFRVITAELSYNSRCREFFMEEFIMAPRAALSEIFRKLMKKGLVKAADPMLLANEFYSYVIYKFFEDYMLRGENNIDFKKMKSEFTEHIRFFTGMICGTEA